MRDGEGEAMRVLILFAVVAGACMAGLTLLGWQHERPAAQAHAALPPPFQATAGAVGHLGQQGDPYDSFVWVEEIALLAYQRAEQDRDGRGESRVMSAFEMVRTPPGTGVRVLERHGGNAHVELLDGPKVGRRGWIDAAWITA